MNRPFPEGGAVRRLLLILRRRWRIFAISWVLVVGVSAVMTFTAPRVYLPLAVLEIRPEMPILSTETQDADFSASRTLWESYYQTQASILNSSTLHAQTLKALPEALRNEYAAQADPVRALSGQVYVERARSSFILKVGIVDPDPSKATQITNILVSVYLEEANRRLRELRSGALEALSREALPSIRQRVEDADKAVQRFLEEIGFVDPRERHSALVEAHRKVLQRLTEVELDQVRLRGELSVLRQYASNGISGIFNPTVRGTRILDLLVNQLEQVQSEMARETQVLKRDHPRIVELEDQERKVTARIKEAIQGVVHSREGDLEVLEHQQKGLMERLSKVEADIARAALQMDQYRRLDAELTGAKELYSSYLKKQGETTATSGTGLGSVRIVDPATVPSSPYKPNRRLNLIFGGLLGLLVGAGAVLTVEQFSDRLHGPQEVEAFVGLEVLTVVPRLTPPEGQGVGPLLLGSQSTAPEYEAFRVLRVEIVARLEKIHGGKVVSVLSAVGSEGKSTVTVNLAQVLALEGRRVLVLDGDMRRPGIAPGFGASDVPNLEDVLAGRTTLEDAARPGAIAGVHLLGRVKGSSQAAELAGSTAFERLLARARETYEYVIVDTPPVNLVSEAAPIARLSDGGILVVRDRQTSRGAVQAAARRLSGLGVRLFGVVLNCTEGRDGSYDYGYGYGYYLTGDKQGEAPA
jgi:capsular exopolysaccharide synthesis family protein